MGQVQGQGTFLQHLSSEMGVEAQCSSSTKV